MLNNIFLWRINFLSLLFKRDIYLKNLKDSVNNGYYTRGSMLNSHKGITDKDFHALYSAMDEVAENSINARKMDIFRKNIKEFKRNVKQKFISRRV